METKAKKQIKGTVVSDKMDKTRVVAVKKYVQHPKYKKYYTITKRFKAHDVENAYKTGDEILMEEIRPMSKDKRFTIVGKA